MPPDPYPIMRHFTYQHLPPHLAGISKPFCELAEEMARTLPQNAETSTALRKLMEAKDCAVRSFLEKDPRHTLLPMQSEAAPPGLAASRDECTRPRGERSGVALRGEAGR